MGVPHFDSYTHGPPRQLLRTLKLPRHQIANLAVRSSILRKLTHAKGRLSPPKGHSPKVFGVLCQSRVSWKQTEIQWNPAIWACVKDSCIPKINICGPFGFPSEASATSASPSGRACKPLAGRQSARGPLSQSAASWRWARGRPPRSTRRGPPKSSKRRWQWP